MQHCELNSALLVKLIKLVLCIGHGLFCILLGNSNTVWPKSGREQKSRENS